MSVENGSAFFTLPIYGGYVMDEQDVDFTTKSLQPTPLEAKERNEFEAVCTRYATDTWSGLERMSQTPTGFPVDMIRVEDGVEISNSDTSPTNIGLFLASIVAARDMDLMLPKEADLSINTILTSLESAKKDRGLFFNWYDTQTGSVSKKVNRPFISTVDNSWLAVGLMIIQAASDPESSARAQKIIEQMEFSTLYDRNRDLFFGGYFADSQEPTEWHYDILNTEARIASYVGINTFNIPPINYGRLGRYAPADVELSSSNNKSQFSSWGGSMFEALMPTLFVPEQEWSNVWQDNHIKYVDAQIKDGEQNNNGAWGVSPCYNGTYHEEGLAALAIKERGYGSSGVITPHASFLSLPFASAQAIDNVMRLEHAYPAFYKNGLGFSDSVDVQTGEVSNSYLTLDQEMSFISLFNYLNGNKMHEYLAPQLEVIKPLIISLDNEMPLSA